MKPSCLTFLFLLAVGVSASAQPPDADPIDPFACDLPELGRMTGELVARRGDHSESFGQEIHPVGDVDGDGLADWVVARSRVDTIIGGRTPEEIILYRGTQDGLPATGSGLRIGPSEAGSLTKFLAAADWDGDGNVDIAARLQVIGDSSGGNTRGYEVATVAVYWGQPQGTYSVDDTTRLSCDGQMWLGVHGLNSRNMSDLDGDGNDDLLLITSRYALSHGELIRIPLVYVFYGNRDVRKRWSAGFSWWTPPPFNQMRALDADVDGAIDLAFFFNERGLPLSGQVSVLYGRPGMLPDTTNIQTVDFGGIDGKVSQFVDLTGDKVPELAVAVADTNTGSVLSVKVFLGLPRQRLIEQYGTGHDPPRPGQMTNWWGKPWAEVWTPFSVNNGAPDIAYALWDLGDAGRDGVDDLWAFSWPHLVAYNGGLFLDSLVDGLVFVPNPNSFNNVVANLGDIDGSGVPTIAIGYSSREIDLPRFAGGILFIKPDSCVPDFANWRMLPPGTDKPPAAVPGESIPVDSLVLTVLPEGDSHVLRWRDASTRFTVHVSLHDLLGRELWRTIVPAGTGHVAIPSAQLPRGAYVVSARRGNQQSSIVLSLP